MADEDEDVDQHKKDYSDQSRFGWNYAGEIKYLDDDGNWVRGGPVPPEIEAILAKHDEEVKKQNAAKAKDARMKRPKIQVHIHRK